MASSLSPLSNPSYPAGTITTTRASASPPNRREIRPSITNRCFLTPLYTFWATLENRNMLIKYAIIALSIPVFLLKALANVTKDLIYRFVTIIAAPFNRQERRTERPSPVIPPSATDARSVTTPPSTFQRSAPSYMPPPVLPQSSLPEIRDSTSPSAVLRPLPPPLPIPDPPVPLETSPRPPLPPPIAVPQVQCNVRFNPMEGLFTINAHGLWSNTLFVLPLNVYVLSPCRQGFDVPYRTFFPLNISIESILYGSPPGTLPTPIGQEWRVYRPGEEIRDIALHPWNPVGEFARWRASLPANAQADADNIPSDAAFFPVPARDAQGQQYRCGSRLAIKVKIFAPTSLSAIITAARTARSPEQPIVLLPLTCNATTNSNQDIPIHFNSPATNPTNIIQLFAHL